MSATDTDVSVESIEHLDEDYPCEVVYGDTSTYVKCPRPADWMITTSCCGDVIKLCDPCWSEQDLYSFQCLTCGHEDKSMTYMVAAMIRIR